jgi:hypothetical protein
MAGILDQEDAVQENLIVGDGRAMLSVWPRYSLIPGKAGSWTQEIDKSSAIRDYRHLDDFRYSYCCVMTCPKRTLKGRASYLSALFRFCWRRLVEEQEVGLEHPSSHR